MARAAAGESVIVWSRRTKFEADLLRASTDVIMLKPFTDGVSSVFSKLTRIIWKQNQAITLRTIKSRWFIKLLGSYCIRFFPWINRKIPKALSLKRPSRQCQQQQKSSSSSRLSIFSQLPYGILTRNCLDNLEKNENWFFPSPLRISWSMTRMCIKEAMTIEKRSASSSPLAKFTSARLMPN